MGYVYGNNVISIQSATEQQILIRVINTSGSIIQSNQIKLQQGVNSVPVAASYWTKGMYIISFTAASGEIQMRKLIK